MEKKQLGRIGEAFAKDILEDLGHTILHKNYFSPLGEIDIISKKNNTLVFTEVKTRTSDIFGKGFESVSDRKINRIKKIAEKFTVDQNWMGNVQLLVVSISYVSSSKMEYEILEIY